MSTPIVDPTPMSARARGIIQQQIGLSIIRSILLCLTTAAFMSSQTILTSYLGLIEPSCSISACVWFQNRGFVVTLLVVLIAGCFNDLVICCIWDIYTRDSVFATVAAQLFISAALVVALVLSMFSIVRIYRIPIIASPTSGYWTYIAPSFPALGFIFTLYLMYLVARVWLDGPEGSWKRGVKDLYNTPTPKRWGIFGSKRSDDGDDTRILVNQMKELFRNVSSWLYSWLKQTVNRHISGVENKRFAMMRNIIAITELSALTLFILYLFWRVVNESFDPREMRAPFLGDYNYDNGIRNMWTVCKNPVASTYQGNHSRNPWTQYSVTSDVYAGLSLDSLLNHPSLCSNPTSFGLFGSTEGSSAQLCHTRSNSTATMPPQGEVIYDIAMFYNTMASSQQANPGGMWWILPTGYTPTEVVEYFGTVFQYVPGVYVRPGFHQFGVLKITERRLIQKSFLEMTGFFRPTYRVFPLLTPKWTISVPLQNTSIARVTLSIEMPTAKTMLGDTPYHHVIQDIRTRTFLGALSVAAAILALLQGVHVRLFGKVLLWGIFGSKFLDPFGLFGAYAFRKQMKCMAGMYDKVDPSLVKFFVDTGLINFDPLLMGVDVHDENAVRLDGAEGEETQVMFDESRVGEAGEVELQDVSRSAGTSPPPEVDRCSPDI